METTTLQTTQELWDRLMATLGEFEQLMTDNADLADQVNNDLPIFADARQSFAAAKLEIQSGHSEINAARKEWVAMSERAKIESGTSAFENDGDALRDKTQNQILPHLDEHLHRAQLQLSVAQRQAARAAKKQAQATKAQPAASKPQATPAKPKPAAQKAQTKPQAKPASTSTPAAPTPTPNPAPATTATPANAGKPRHTNRAPSTIHNPLLAVATGAAVMFGYDTDDMTDEAILATLSRDQIEKFEQLSAATQQRRAQHALRMLGSIRKQADGNNQPPAAPAPQPVSNDEGGRAKRFVGKMLKGNSAKKAKKANLDNEEQF